MTIWNIRKLAPEDAAVFRSLRLEGLQKSPSAFGRTYEDYSELPIEEIAARMNPSSENFTLGAFDGSQRLCAVVGIEAGKGIKRSHKAMVWGMYVTPVHRGRGLGRLILTEVIELAKESSQLEFLTLSVNSDNLAALSLYQSLGFHPWGIEPQAMKIEGKNYDEVHMQLLLTR